MEWSRSRIALPRMALPFVVSLAAACGASAISPDWQAPLASYDLCFITWWSPSRVPGKFDVYYLQWENTGIATGVNEYDGALRRGILLLRATDGLNFEERFEALDGDFVLENDPFYAGSPLSFVDSTPQPFYTITTANIIGAVAGSGGTGNYTGMWSDPNPSAPLLLQGEGAIVVSVHGTSFTLGAISAYTFCN